jgi:trimeric autotransporter adhesin
MLRTSIAAALAFVCTLVAFACGARAQCSTVLLPAGSAGTSFSNSVLATTLAANGDLVVGGDFTAAPGAAANRVARWNGSSWSALGSGCNGSVNALATLINGDIVAGGTFTTAGGVAAANIARWDGVAWHAMGSGTNGAVTSMLTLPSGDLIAGGSFTMAGGAYTPKTALWIGGAWLPMAYSILYPSMSNDYAGPMVLMADGTVVAALWNYVFGSTLLRWDGTAWQSFVPWTGATTSYSALLTTANGDLVVGGRFSSIGAMGSTISADGFARWDGATFVALPSTGGAPITALAELPNGDLLAGSQGRVRRCDGTMWSTVATTSDYVTTMLALPQGEIAIGGRFSSATGVSSPYLLHMSTTCPATAVASGSGCAGGGGTNQLTATSGAWIGNTFRSRATGMPNFGYAAAVYGMAPLNVPLDSVLFGALPGCFGYAVPDFLEVALPMGGQASFQLPVPYQLALIGLQFHQFVLVQELDAQWAFLDFTSSNGLTIKIGHL